MNGFFPAADALSRPAQSAGKALYRPFDYKYPCCSFGIFLLFQPECSIFDETGWATPSVCLAALPATRFGMACLLCLFERLSFLR